MTTARAGYFCRRVVDSFPVIWAPVPPEAKMGTTPSATSRSEPGYLRPHLLADTPERLRDAAHDKDAPLRVTLMHDNELSARGLASMLRGHLGQIELVSMSGPRTKPIDIVLFDPVNSGPYAPTFGHLLADPYIRKVVLFASNYQPWTASDLIDQGASAYLSKNLTSGELVQALQTVNAGGVVVSSGATSTQAPGGDQTDRGEVLTGREAEVLSLICDGLNNIQIAGTLNLSPNTVKSYIRSCYRKIDVDSRSMAVLWGLRHGFGGGPGAPALVAGAVPS